MKDYRNWGQRIADAADLPGEAMPGMPVVELLGDHRVLIECHRGIAEYTKDQIGVKVSFGCLCVRGCGLHMRIMTRERLVISGKIESITVIRR